MIQATYDKNIQKEYEELIKIEKINLNSDMLLCYLKS